MLARSIQAPIRMRCLGPTVRDRIYRAVSMLLVRYSDVTPARVAARRSSDGPENHQVISAVMRSGMPGVAFPYLSGPKAATLPKSRNLFASSKPKSWISFAITPVHPVW